MAHLGLVTVIVPDEDDGIAFFVDGLGFELVTDAPSTADDGTPKRWVVVRPSGAGSDAAGLLLARARGEEQTAGIGRQFAGRVGLFLHVEPDRFDAYLTPIERAGGTIMETPRSEPYGRVVVFCDPWGNRWDLLAPS